MLKPEISEGVIFYSFSQENKLNAMIAEKVKTELGVHFEEPGTKMAMDLGNITFIDSLGFAALLSVLKKARNNSGLFRICNIRRDVLRVFLLLQLQNVFQIYNTREECLKSFL